MEPGHPSRPSRPGRPARLTRPGGGSSVVHYNKNLFRAAGLDAPKEDWTFDDLLTAARRLNRPEQLWGARFDDYLGCYILYGGRAAPDYSRVTVSNPTNQGVLQFLRDLWARHNVAPPPGPQFRDKSPDQQFAEGRVAITMRHSIQLRFMRKIDGFEVQVRSVLRRKRCSLSPRVLDWFRPPTESAPR